MVSVTISTSESDECEYDVVVIGGGFFGCSIALYLKKYFNSVLIIEKEADLLQRASYNNQARVHNGYHYPRSFLTALRSRYNFPQFVTEYRSCIVDNFTSYYAIAKKFSKINVKQFKNFCDRIDAPLEVAPLEVKKWFANSLIEEVFTTQEYVFDTVKLKERIWQDIQQAKIKVLRQTKALKIVDDQGIIKIILKSASAAKTITTKYAFNCTYSALNQILSASNLTTIPLKHELTEMLSIEVPQMLQSTGITIMCGDFFSLMPFPSLGLHTLSHVRYTPHYSWQNEDKKIDSKVRSSATNYNYVIADVKRYLPGIEASIYRGSLWEIKTVLPQSENDDSRPILFLRDRNLPNLISVLGAKIDNIYDLHHELNFLFEEKIK
jgi:glycine/D-amino acid oxidase-like deaminating enzyme